MEGCAGRYPADVAPFAAVGADDASIGLQLARIVMPGESIYLLGVIPKLGSEWTVLNRSDIPQLVCPSSIPVRRGPEWMELGEAHRVDMLALTGLVFPGFFRARTQAMGRYVGIYEGAVLAAMAGERLRMKGYQEISAVCTHPQFVGRGYAQRLVAEVSNAALVNGRIPFLHVYRENVRAMAIYEKLGFRHRADIPLWHVTRNAA